MEPGLAGQYEEDGLEHVFRMVPVAHELVAQAQHHGPVSPHQAGERGFTHGVVAASKSLEELPVSQPGHGAAVEERLDLPEDRW